MTHKLPRGFASLLLILVIVAGIFALGGAGWWILRPSQASSELTTDEASTTTSANNLPAIKLDESTSLYTNRQFNFSFSYPNTLVATTSSSGTSGMVNLKNAETIVALSNITVGDGTDGSFTVYASTDPNDIGNCTTSAVYQEGGAPATSSVIVNGTAFTSYVVDQAAMGSFGHSSVYKVLRPGACLAIEAAYNGRNTSHLSGPAAAQNVADFAAISGKLDKIVQSFQFTN